MIIDKARNFIGRLAQKRFNNSQFDIAQQAYNFSPQAGRFLPEGKTRKNSKIYLTYQVTDDLSRDSNERKYLMRLIYQDSSMAKVLLEREGKIYRDASHGNNEIYEQHVREMIEKAKTTKERVIERAPILQRLQQMEREY